MLNSQRKRELSIDTMASWALDGLEPDPQTMVDINTYLDGGMTIEKFIEKSKAL